MEENLFFVFQLAGYMCAVGMGFLFGYLAAINDIFGGNDDDNNSGGT